MAKQSLPFLLFVQVWLQLAVSCSIVEFLPGFQGPLPFHLETGYVGVDEAEVMQLFYYFMKSQRNFKEDPLLLSLTGGHGCTSFNGLTTENGPIKFEVKEYNGSLPTLVLNPNSWTQVSRMIFLDLPVGTGFSYSRDPLAIKRSDFIQVSQAEQFLRWLTDQQEFLSNPVYIAGDSYSGKIVPALVQNISNENDEGVKPLINLNGYILGNPATDSSFDGNSRIPFAHRMGLISDELYESLKKSWGGEYQMIDPNNSECLKSIDAFSECISNIAGPQILDHKCPHFPLRTTQIDLESDLPAIECFDYVQLLATYWANEDNVRKALHVPEGSIGAWQRCNFKQPYTREIQSSIKYHIDLGIKGYRRLIYSGDHDMHRTQAWIRSLNYSILDDWRPRHVQGQVGGYTRTYSNQLTFATVKGGGHEAPRYRPAECFAMFQSWITDEPL